MPLGEDSNCALTLYSSGAVSPSVKWLDVPSSALFSGRCCIKAAVGWGQRPASDYRRCQPERPEPPRVPVARRHIRRGILWGANRAAAGARQSDVIWVDALSER
jgi:hypothetical protein